jgi:two-component system, chemotaxis family, protein-glutamate methylesterase/glutaminase
MPNRNFIVVIGASAGGNIAIPQLLKQLGPELNVAVLIVFHLAKMSVAELFLKRIQKSTELKCEVARNGVTIKRGHAYLAAPDHHLLLKDSKLMLGKGPMENRYRPSIDATFRSAAAYHDHKVIGIVLSGMLEDGAAGMVAIKRSGGTCIVQDPNETLYSDMVQAVARSFKPDFTVPVEKMGDIIQKVVKKPPRKSRIPKDVKLESQIAERVSIGIDDMKKIGDNSIYSCPDCGGGLWEMKSNGVKRYRCHVGHAFTEVGLLSGMQASTETALWTALRIIEERRNVLKSLAEKEKGREKQGARRYLKRINELETQIQHIKRVLFNIESDV